MTTDRPRQWWRKGRGEPQPLADPHRDMGGLPGLADDGGQVISDRVQVHRVLEPRRERGQCGARSYRARLNRRSTDPTQNWPICASPAMRPCWFTLEPGPARPDGPGCLHAEVKRNAVAVRLPAIAPRRHRQMASVAGPSASVDSFPLTAAMMVVRPSQDPGRSGDGGACVGRQPSVGIATVGLMTKFGVQLPNFSGFDPADLFDHIAGLATTRKKPGSTRCG